MYRTNELPPTNLPKFCWVEMADYAGPTFFPENGSRKQWVLIYPIRGEAFYVAGKSLSTTMLPLRLAWAWTIWKAQGQTIRGKVVIKLGKSEREHGLSYVAFSSKSYSTFKFWHKRWDGWTSADFRSLIPL